MRCIVCDKCKTILEDYKAARSVALTRTMQKKSRDTNGRDDQDVIWQKDLCVACAASVEDFISSTDDSEEAGG